MVTVPSSARTARPSSSFPSPRRRSRRAHAGGRGGSPPGSAPRPGPRRRALAVAALAQRGGCERGGELAGLGAAHAVGDREERWVADEGCPRCGGACGRCRSRRSAGRSRPSLYRHCSNRRSVSPTRTTSPGDEPPLAGEADAVDERAVGRAGVRDVDAVAPRLEARVPGRGVLVAVDRDVVRARRGRSSATRSRSRNLALLQCRARDDDDAAELAARPAAGGAARPAAGERIIDSCGSRRSRAAERTIRQMKR